MNFFWQWFVETFEHADLNNLDAHVVKELDDNIIQLGPFSWEMGPDESGGKYFSISPNGDATLLKDVAAIVSQAPSIAGWSFLECKQRRTPFTILKIDDPNNGPLEIQLGEWAYKLFKFENDYDIELAYPTDLKISKEALECVAHLSIIGAIGEKAYLSHIVNINTIKCDSEDYGGIEFKHLRQHFDQILEQALDG